MYELVTKLGLRRTDNHFYYTLYSLSVGEREEGTKEVPFLLARPGPRFLKLLFFPT